MLIQGGVFYNQGISEIARVLFGKRQRAVGDHVPRHGVDAGARAVHEQRDLPVAVDDVSPAGKQHLIQRLLHRALIRERNVALEPGVAVAGIRRAVLRRLIERLEVDLRLFVSRQRLIDQAVRLQDAVDDQIEDAPCGIRGIHVGRLRARVVEQPDLARLVRSANIQRAVRSVDVVGQIHADIRQTGECQPWRE